MPKIRNLCFILIWVLAFDYQFEQEKSRRLWEYNLHPSRHIWSDSSGHGNTQDSPEYDDNEGRLT